MLCSPIRYPSTVGPTIAFEAHDRAATLVLAHAVGELDCLLYACASDTVNVGTIQWLLVWCTCDDASETTSRLDHQVWTRQNLL